MAKVRVKLGGAEAEIEADLEDLTAAIAMIPEVIAKLQSAATLPAKQPDEVGRDRRAGRPEERGFSQTPVVSVEKGDSLADVIAKFFADPWGRERRKLSDVRQALEAYGMNYPKQSVAVALLRLAKATKVRRFKADDGEFVYISAVMPTPAPSAGLSETAAAEDSASQNLI